MSDVVNRIILVGFIAQPPEFESGAGGEKTAARFWLCTHWNWADSEPSPGADALGWHYVVCTKAHALRALEKRCHVGTRIYLEGRARSRMIVENGLTRGVVTDVTIEPENCELHIL
ncbi:single-stranded DNA-binding protein [Acetobacter sicerae]|uniref:single-stranded DNA-binding protein n=1 Tax=Acetobacter sicerae TaxID=85325 RepID=UPI00156B265A|nr:single-stranded DNA-binding protein [Acetobacter sicerae]NHN93541.1 single-stranded DNA-binding protein [Acetobacter sicerae]